jgi:hypothetical protein
MPAISANGASTTSILETSGVVEGVNGGSGRPMLPNGFTQGGNGGSEMSVISTLCNSAIECGNRRSDTLSSVSETRSGLSTSINSLSFLIS